MLLERRWVVSFLGMEANRGMFNASQVLDAVNRGEGLPQQTKEIIRRQLKSLNPQDDPYTLIHILGKANDMESREIVEKYLDFGIGFGCEQEEPEMVRRIAVQVLCDWWVLPEHFGTASQLAFNDPSIEVQMAAAVSLGNFGKHHPVLRQEAATFLLQGFENSSGDQELWESFYEGMLQLVEVPYDSRPDPTIALQSEKIDNEVVKTVRTIARGKKGSRTL